MTKAFQARLERILAAVALDSSDRVPVVLEYSGCDIPNNARLENVQAMVAAATEL